MENRKKERIIIYVMFILLCSIFVFVAALNVYYYFLCDSYHEEKTMYSEDVSIKIKELRNVQKDRVFRYYYKNVKNVLETYENICHEMINYENMLEYVIVKEKYKKNKRYSNIPIEVEIIEKVYR